MTISELKEYIYKENKIEYILREIGCGHIEYHPNKEYYSCSNKDGDNKSAINVKNNEYLNVINWTRTKDFDENADLITLVQYNEKFSFIDALKYIHKILGIPFELKRKEEKIEKKYNPLYVFEKIRRYNRKIIDVDDIHILDDKLLNDYVSLLHIDWVHEGIMPWTRDKFGLAYSYKNSRVVIPIRYWCTGELLGFNMRTTVPNYEEFGIKKYILTSGFNKSLNIYGLYENYESIQKARYAVIMESEKSVLKRDSLLDDTVVALSGKNMSDEQVSILKGLNVEIIIGLDKDVELNEIRHMCSKFYRTRTVSYIYDKWDLLKDKESPADAPDKIYKFLFKHRIRYNESEHKLYLDSLKKG